ncbi:ATP-binding protein [Kribbella sandramycini]|uniref:ATP-binding protein n=1 Tax=Kribbella sandramycini TaxID=60450 RepID=UPI0031D197D5
MAGGLVGRRADRARLGQVVTGVRAGAGQVLIVHGEAGIGKTALLDEAAGAAEGCQVARAAGVESEMELAFAGLHQLCAPYLALAEQLPQPQRVALKVAFGIEFGGPPDRFLVGAAVLTLLSAVADRTPLLCLIDDAQWLDQASAQTLTFVGRRLLADRIGLVFAVREPVIGPEWRGFPQLAVRGLNDRDAGALLDAVFPGRLDERVRDRIVSETGGNPLALIELPRGRSAGELAGGFERPDARPVTSQLEQNFVRRVRELPAPTQLALLVAATEPVGDVALLLRALASLGVPVEAMEPAESAGLISVDALVRFRHPMVRSASIRAADPAERRRAHQTLAGSIDRRQNPDRRAWHLAHAAVGPDEEVAAELVDTADRAQRRGGVAAAAAFLRRATELTPVPADRAVRALGAAGATLKAGDFETALRLLATAHEGSTDELHLARVDLLRGQVAFQSGHSTEAPALLLDVARRLEPLDLDLARDTYLDVIAAAQFAGRLGGPVGVAEMSRAARAAPPAQVTRKRDLVLDAISLLFTDGYPAGVEPARRALRAFIERSGPPDQDEIRWLWMACLLAVDLWDDESWDLLTERYAQIARDLGDLNELPLVLHHRVMVGLFAGDLAAAAALLAEIRTIDDATRAGLSPYGQLCLAALRGDPGEAGPFIAKARDESMARGEGGGATTAHFANALLLNGLARYDEALVAAREATAYPVELGVANWALPELIESAALSGERELAAEGLDRLARMARACGTDWALGLLARSTGLLATTAAEAESAYQEAIQLLSRTRMRMDLARAQLLYGEWLRRAGRRQDARVQLRTAYKLFAEAGAEAFADRAGRELVATGETVGRRAGRATDALTPQEAHIAELAGAGLTNAEIGAQMFLSQHTVDWHLRKVFAKLGITSRKQLRP